MTLEQKIIENMTAQGRSLSEASTDAFNYVTAWMKGEVDPETISRVSGIPTAELIEQAKTMRLSRMNTNQLREMAVRLGADRKTLYGTSRTAMIIKIHKLQEEAKRRTQA